jgi:ribosomal protein S2
MKLKNLKIKKHTLLKLHLLKYQAYKNNSKSFINRTVDHLELSLKQALNLIYSYHSSNKRILFIGFPYIKSKLILKDSPHFFMQKKLWVNGLFGNKNANFQNSKQKNTLLNGTSFNKDPDLVVFFNASNKDTGILKELSTLGCPLISLGSQNSVEPVNITYNVPAFLLRKNMKQLCSFLIYSILRKSKKHNNFYD